MKKYLEKVLQFFARVILKRHNPIIIGVTGNVGKTSTRDAIFAVLRAKYFVRKSRANYNNELGVPLTILGVSHRGKNIFKWLWDFCVFFWKEFIIKAPYPEILILEMGADKPGDIAHLAKLAPPHIAVITAIGEIPAHVEFFAGPKELAEEKSELAKALPSEGTAIINVDDDVLTDIKKNIKAKIKTFGFGDDASARIKEIKYETDYSALENTEMPDGMTVLLNYEGKDTAVKLENTFGKPQAYAIAAAFLLGTNFGMSREEIALALRNYTAPPGRMRLLKGIKHSWILDDTYNSSPAALHEAIDLLQKLPGKRKIAVIGDMLEIGKYTEAAHRTMGDKISQFADTLITVGPRARFIAEEAMAGGVENTRFLKREDVHMLNTAEEAGKLLDPLLQAGDLILIKGSQAMRMEKAVLEIMAEPEKAPDILVRQNSYWKRK